MSPLLLLTACQENTNKDDSASKNSEVQVRETKEKFEADESGKKNVDDSNQSDKKRVYKQGEEIVVKDQDGKEFASVTVLGVTKNLSDVSFLKDEEKKNTLKLDYMYKNYSSEDPFSVSQFAFVLYDSNGLAATTSSISSSNGSEVSQGKAGKADGFYIFEEDTDKIKEVEMDFLLYVEGRGQVTEKIKVKVSDK